jgi:hypothetical protein
MIYFALTRMWMYHGKINEKLFAKFSDIIKVKGKLFLEHPVSFSTDNAIQGKIQAKWRDFSPEQEEGHELFPYIDLVPDAATFTLFGNYLLEGTKGCDLFDCRFRITDFGYLNVVLIFSAEDLEGLNKLSKLQAIITRKINEWIPTLDPVLIELLKQGYVHISDDYFGIPLKIKDYLNIDHTDMYLYQDITVLTADSRKLAGETRELYAINDEPEKIEKFEIHGIDQSPIICLDKDTGIQGLYELIEPYSLLLAELNSYDSASNLNYAIINLMNVSDMTLRKERKFFRKNKLIIAFRNFTTSDLRKITINTHYILHCINLRKASILPWQNLFLRRFKEKNSYDENRENYERSETIIARLIEEKSQLLQKSHSNMLEILFLFLSAITIYSTYVDIANFLNSKHNNFSSFETSTLEVKLFLSITFILAFVLVYIIRVKRKG